MQLQHPAASLPLETMRPVTCDEGVQYNDGNRMYSHDEGPCRDTTASQGFNQSVRYPAHPNFPAMPESFYRVQSRSAEDLSFMHAHGHTRRSSDPAMRSDPSQMFAFEPSSNPSLKTELDADPRNTWRLMSAFDPSDPLTLPLLSAPISSSLAADYLSPYYRQTDPSSYLSYGPSPPQSANSDSSSASGFSQSTQQIGHPQRYAFIELAGNATKKRPRRRYDEIDRLYGCAWPVSIHSFLFVFVF